MGASSISDLKKRMKGSRSDCEISECDRRTGRCVVTATTVQKRTGEVSYSFEMDIVGFKIGR